MATAPDASDDPRLAVRRTAALIILLFWLAHFTALSSARLFGDSALPAFSLVPRGLVTVVGIALSFGIFAAQRALRTMDFARRILITIVISIVCSLIHALSNSLAFATLMPDEYARGSSGYDYFMAILDWLWVYAALSGILMASTYSFDLRDRDRRVAQLRAIAHAAQLRALRYQVNPHFLFNTLNSIAALVSQRRNDVAEAMVENLADFLRAGLALDPLDDIPLHRELALQTLYLDIEKLRFPDRLIVAFDVAEDAGEALVPALILQPLVENAVRYAVTASSTPVTLRIAAAVRGDRLSIEVSDSGGNGGAPVKHGTGVGHANIRDRLQARFGADACFATAARSDGFTACVDIPLTCSAS